MGTKISRYGQACLGGIALISCNAARPEHPNIIYVFPDQMRNCAMSFWNEPEYEGIQGWTADPVQTPRLDAFAGESVVLSRAMSTCPVSSPYRGMCLSGMYPERNGVVLNCMAERPESTLNPEAVCISDVLSANGYFCGYIGKLHAEAPMKNDPANPGHYVSDLVPEWDAYTPKERRHGFSYWYSYGTFDEHKNPHYWDTEGVRHDPHEFSVRHETDKAIEFLRNRNGERDPRKPFMLMVAYNPPHSPYNGLEDCMEEDYRLYRDKPLDELYVRPNADTTLTKAQSIRYYFANVTAVDREFGRILDEVKKLGLEKNTIVVFTSDHGETMCSQGTYDPKNSIYTESFNVPFMIRYPEKLRHRIDTAFFTTTDIMPTLLSLAGLEEEIPQSVQGFDLSDGLMSQAGGTGRRDAALYMRNLNGIKDADNIVHGFFPEARGIRTSRYTMEISIRRDNTLKKVMLFDDVADPYQMNCLDYREHSEIFADMCSRMQRLLEESDDVWFREDILGKLDFINDTNK
ncbi:MAG: sulfatase [Clostridium sp.]|nr:sulfatase [Bacteroides sp.]MCM1198608.1 sulfatase [Clostridium sp.]